MWNQILDEFSNHFILLGVAICVTLVAIWAGQSRLHWFLRGCVVAAVLALFLPVRAHEPLLFFLIAAPVVSLGVAWMESRRERVPAEIAPAVKKPRQLSLRGAFLLLGLLGMACGLGSAAYRGGLMMDWRCLPVSALLFATVAMMSYRVGAFPQGLSHRWALGASLASAAGLFAWYALRGRLYFYPLGTASTAEICAWWAGIFTACLVVFIVGYLELRFGSPRHFVALVGVVFLAPRIELGTLGDWMFVGDVLFPVYETGARTPGLIILTIAYGLLATALVMFVALGRLAFSTKGAAWKKHLARAANVCAAGLLLYSLGGLYWRLAWTMAPPAVAMTERGENPLEEALLLVDEFYSLEYPDRGFVFVPGEFPKGLERHQPGKPMAAVYAQLVDQLQKPGWVPMDIRKDASDPTRQSQNLVLFKLLTFSSVLDADADEAMQRKDFDAAIPYVMAQSQMEDNLRRGGLMMHRGVGTTGLLKLAALRSDISAANARQVLKSLRRFEREREPFDVTLQREQVWEERELNWRSRIRRLIDPGGPIFGSRPGRRSLYPLDMFRESDQASLAYQRLLATEFALRLFREDHGQLPRQLKELVPNYLDAVPLDPFSDQSLVYRVTDGKYRLYTVWSNGLDDEGNTGKGDVVEFREHLAVDADLDTAVRNWVKAKDDAKAKAARDARVKASMGKAQMGGRTPTPPPPGGE